MFLTAFVPLLAQFCSLIFFSFCFGNHILYLSCIEVPLSLMSFLPLKFATNVNVYGPQRLLDMLKVSFCDMLRQGDGGTHCGLP